MNSRTRCTLLCIVVVACLGRVLAAAHANEMSQGVYGNLESARRVLVGGSLGTPTGRHAPVPATPETPASPIFNHLLHHQLYLMQHQVMTMLDSVGHRQLPVILRVPRCTASISL